MSGSDIKNFMSTHCLRGALASLLFEADHLDSSISMRTGHRDSRSSPSYHNLRVAEVCQQRGPPGNQHVKNPAHLSSDDGHPSSFVTNAEFRASRSPSSIPNASNNAHTVNLNVPNMLKTREKSDTSNGTYNGSV